jgi:hypothetical protein
MRTPCHYFVSYANADQHSVDQLMDLLRPRLKIASGFEFNEWIDHNIVIGEDWRNQILTAIDQAEFGLLLLSPSFFASDFIVDEELRRFISTHANSARIHKAIVPVALKAIPLDGSAHLHGLQHTQIFHDQQQRCFQQCRGQSKDGFVDRLVSQLINKLKAA